MKIMVLGATSQTGKAILHELEQTDHEISVYVRNPAKIVDESRYQVLTGDMLDEPKLEEALFGQDIVIAGLSGDRLLQMAQNLVFGKSCPICRCKAYFMDYGDGHSP
jgi:putative NADH-flavin reductase